VIAQLHGIGLFKNIWVNPPTRSRPKRRLRQNRNPDSLNRTEQMDTPAPAGKMVFTVFGAVAELECSLIEFWGVPEPKE
jgi:hypothetical protein